MTTTVVYGQEWSEVEVTILLEVLLYVDGGRAKAQHSQRPQSVLSMMISSRGLQGENFSSLTPYN
jgi:hypothetical protein